MENRADVGVVTRYPRERFRGRGHLLCLPHRNCLADVLVLYFVKNRAEVGAVARYPHAGGERFRVERQERGSSTAAPAVDDQNLATLSGDYLRGGRG